MSRVLLSVRTSADIGSTFGGTTLVSSVAGNFPTRLGFHLTKVVVTQNTSVATTAWTILRARRGDVISTFALFPGGGSSEQASRWIELELDIAQVDGFDLTNGSSELSAWVYGD